MMDKTTYEAIMLEHSQNDVLRTFNSDVRVRDHQNSPKTVLHSVLATLR